jgi:hypothetical protein
MNAKNERSKQVNEHQNQPPKKGQNPNDAQSRQMEQPQMIGADDIKEIQQLQGIGRPHDKNRRQPNR